MKEGQLITFDDAAGCRLYDLMQKKEMSAYALSGRTGLSRSTIGDIIKCKNHNSMKLSTLYIICQGLDIEVADFFDNEVFLRCNLEP